jgi:hypothetical protein
MGNFLEVFSNLSGDQKGQLAMQAAKLVPTIIGFNQASKAADQQREYLEDIKELEKNRQVVTNPYANVTNPYANLQVATKAAEMQADQTDIALANTLDQLRQTGAGGATALAQAALKSKQGVAADIQRQEAQNQKLQAQGQQQMEMAQARGAGFAFQAQERRDEAQLDRLQGLADIEAARRQQGISTGVGGLVSGIGGSAQALINPKAQDFSNFNIPSTEDVNLSAANLANTTLADIQSSYNPVDQLPVTSSLDLPIEAGGRITPRGGGNISTGG